MINPHRAMVHLIDAFLHSRSASPRTQRMVECATAALKALLSIERAAT